MTDYEGQPEVHNQPDFLDKEFSIGFWITAEHVCMILTGLVYHDTLYK